MKASLSCLFLSSLGLFYFPSLCATETLLSPQDSIDGENTTSFTGNATTTDTTYTLTGDVSFAHLGETTALTNSCFSNASESLSFLGNGFSLSFDTIKSSAEGAAISVSASDKHLSLSGFSKLSFLSSPTSSSPANNSEKGAIKCGGNVEIADTTSVVFSKNASANDGGAISTKALSLSKNSAVSFSENTVATGKKGGAIYASGQVEISSSLATVSFVNNSAGVSGGAIYTETGCSLIGNNSLVFDSNKATETDGNGGAIYCIAPAASPTNQPSNPAQNNSGGSGSSGGSSAPAGTPGTPGSSSSSPSPSSPASPPSSPGGTTARVLLGKHASVPAVGAGATAPELILSGNQSLVFTNNSATANGGAIYAKNLTLSSAGTGAFFVNNRVTNATAPKGGAIAIAQSGTISLSAEGGNITFDGNIAHTSGVTPASKRNAIDLADSAKFTNLRATAGNSIFFYDPITSSTTGNTGNTTTDILTINQTDPTTKQEYGGTIVFSGEKLSKEEKAIQDNLNSTFAQAVTLSNGTLALKEGVTLTVNKAFVQEESSLLLMDVGTKLASTTEDITVTNLAINVNSLVSGDPTRRATLEVSGSGKSINLSGPITLTDPYGNAYEQHELGASKVFDFVEFITPAALTTSNFPIAQDTQEHFGHQGTWSILWSSAPTAPGATPIKTTATVTWTKTGYVPNLEQRASLVPNTLWGTFMDMRAVHHLLGICSVGEQHRQGFWIASVGNFFHRDGTERAKRYRHIAAGYALAGSALTPKEDAITLAFCQLYLRDKDYDVTKNKAQTYAGSLFFKHLHTLHPRDFFTLGRSKLPKELTSKLPEEFPVHTDIQVTFGYTSNTMKTRYTRYPEAEGSWDNEFISGEASAYIPGIQVHPLPFLPILSPVVKVHLAYAHQGSFSEISSEGRAFTNSRLLNLALPVGLKLKREYTQTDGGYCLSVYYVPDVYRHNPHCLTTLLYSGDSWKTYATNPSRQAFLILGENHFIFDPRWEVFGHCAAEIRSSSRNYSVDLGSKIRF
ncbi:hypothetical protein KY091_02080 [Chlamydia pecorum]|uniref:polymorphic outer membrane protein middle domain-containing protein n=1 Tax=Chlamydia pecorum TaxID=85991 RepID=UPI001E410CB9|nr:polymorphic outer membrane protein middle domain-containing protein [Chlamydia pecorum]UFP07124.1 hypothetical protein KY091_02080 [Chlamydia pecorum]